VAVNLSPAQLRHHAGVPQAIGEALRRHGLDPRWLELEITESVLLERADGTTDRAPRGLVAGDVRLTLDDFGTGYSSLSYLRRLPAATIKIDRSFVRGIGSDPDDEAVVRAIVTLGQSLGKRVVAEGVESEAQLAFLRRLGCDAAQGFLLARPQEAGRLALMPAA
jgi:EAL domain-containing protein (putative c-di-GMP-specific phosphodiesterase class I)